MIQRIFHTIGQGAFYSERHENCNIVFDCGTEWKNRAKNIFNKVVTQSFSEKEIIDILFISHFDYDHISKIKTLKNHVSEIKRVVLPLLHNNEKILLSNFYRVLDINLLTLINEPEKYFGGNTKIIYVRPSENFESAINDNNEVTNLDDIERSQETSKFEIDSGFKITIPNLNNWTFIPFNYNYPDNHQALINELNNEGFNTDNLKTNPNYTLSEIVRDVSISATKGGKKFKEIYNRLSGKINQNSMFLYSGPIQSNLYHKHCYIGNMHRQFHHYLYYHCDNFDKVSCIYTGDGDLNVVDIKTVYNRYWENVGTIQIPHHGDLKSFNKKVLNDYNYCCPISVGKNNSYGHPSNKVIAEILSNRSCPIFVSEELDSMYIEIIDNR